MYKLNCKILSLTLVLIISISMFSFPIYAISESCVEDHFGMLKFDYEGDDNDEIRTPPSENTCPYVAMSLLLTFYDSYWDDSFVENDYEWENGTYNSSNDNLMETFAPTEEAEDWENYIDNNVPNGEYAYPYYRIYALDHYSFFLEPYLVSLGVSLGLHPDPNESLGLNSAEIVQVLSHYLYNVCNFSTSQIEVKYLHEYNGDIDTVMRNQINNGFPVIYLGRRISNGATFGHALIAYGIDETNDVLLHTGWGRNEFQKSSNTPYNSSRGIIWLEINEENLPHQCSDAYHDSSDATKTYCACQIYSSHPYHNNNHISISGNLDYDEAYHWTNGCHCGNPGPDSVVTPHNFNYVVTPGSTTHHAECDTCDYSDFEDHNYNQLISVSDTHHTVSCVCGLNEGTEEHYNHHYARNDKFKHHVYCECGHYIGTSFHVVSAQGVGLFKICIHCGEKLKMNEVIVPVPGGGIQSTNQITYITEDGSYVDGNGIIYLVESDMALYLAGELDVYALAENVFGEVKQ